MQEHIDVNQAIKQYVEFYLYRKMRKLTILGLFLHLLSALIVLGAYAAAICSALLFTEHKLLSVLCCVIVIYDFDILTCTGTQHALYQLLFSEDTGNEESRKEVSSAILAILSAILVIYLYAKNIASAQLPDISETLFFIRQIYLSIPLFIMAIGFGIQRLADRQYMKLLQCMQVDVDNIEIKIMEE